MKRWRILPALLALVLAITGCKGPSVAVPRSASHVDLEREVVLSGTASDGETRWGFRIATCTVTGEHCAGDGTQRVLTRHSYQTADMEVFAAEGESALPPAASRAADAFNAYFRQALEENVAWFDEMASVADENYSMTGRMADSLWKNEEYCYTDEAALTFWSNGRLVCVTTDRFSFTGGAHPVAWRSGVTFDLRTGSTVAATDLTDDAEELRSAVYRELLRQAQQRQTGGTENAAPTYYDDYPDTLNDWMERSVLYGDDGMTVIFPAYDIAPYTDGEQSFLIPYDVLAPYLNEYGRSVLELPA